MQASAKRVLIVEDSPDMRKLERRYLEDLGLEVEEASDAAEAFERLAQHRFDLICLDLMLPSSSSGYEVCEFLQRGPETKSIPVLVVSVRNLPADRAYAAELGAAGYLLKPFSRAKLIKQVEQILRLNGDAGRAASKESGDGEGEP